MIDNSDKKVDASLSSTSFGFIACSGIFQRWKLKKIQDLFPKKSRRNSCCMSQKNRQKPKTDFFSVRGRVQFKNTTSKYQKKIWPWSFFDLRPTHLPLGSLTFVLVLAAPGWPRNGTGKTNAFFLSMIEEKEFGSSAMVITRAPFCNRNANSRDRPCAFQAREGMLSRCK
jgi:hypothetical protein